MSNFRLVKDGSAGNYYVAWSEGRSTPRRSMGTPDKGLAQERMKAFVNRMTSPANAEANELSIHHVLTKYWEDVANESHSDDTAVRTFEHFVGYHPETGEKSKRPGYYSSGDLVSAINKSHHKAYEKARKEAGWVNATINRARNFLRAALKHAVDNGDLKAAPHVPTLQVTTKKERWLARNEAARLLWAVRAPRFYYLRMFILIGLHTAARHEAILSLTWAQVDFENGRLDFRRIDKKGNLLPETKKKRPNAPTSDLLMRFLKYAYEREKQLAKKEGRKVIDHVVNHRGGPLLSVKKALQARRAEERHAAHDEAHPDHLAAAGRGAGLAGVRADGDQR